MLDTTTIFVIIAFLALFVGGIVWLQFHARRQPLKIEPAENLRTADGRLPQENARERE